MYGWCMIADHVDTFMTEAEDSAHGKTHTVAATDSRDKGTTECSKCRKKRALPVRIITFFSLFVILRLCERFKQTAGSDNLDYLQFFSWPPHPPTLKTVCLLLPVFGTRNHWRSARPVLRLTVSTRRRECSSLLINIKFLCAFTAAFHFSVSSQSLWLAVGS